MDEIELHQTHVEIGDAVGMAGPVDPDAEAYRWVCACGEGDDDLLRVDAYLEARRHERLVS